MTRLLIIAVALAIVPLTGCTSAQGHADPNYDFTRIDTVAVIEVDAYTMNQPRMNQIGDWFAAELMRKGYSLVDRQHVEAVLKEQQFQSSDLTSPQNAARAGRILNAPAVFVINVPDWGERITMTAKMIETETARVIWVGEGTASTGRTPATIGGALVGAGAGVALGGSSTGRVVGGAAGGVAGGAAGYLLSPSEAKQARKAIRKMGDTLPNRLSPME